MQFFSAGSEDMLETLILKILRKSCHLQQHGWIWRALCSVKEVKERQILCDITYMWNLNNNKLVNITKKETDSKIQRTNQQLPA